MNKTGVRERKLSTKKKMRLNVHIFFFWLIFLVYMVFSLLSIPYITWFTTLYALSLYI